MGIIIIRNSYLKALLCDHILSNGEELVGGNVIIPVLIVIKLYER